MMTKVNNELLIKRLMNEQINWEPDPNKYLRMRATSNGDWIYLLINPSFPDGHAYSLLTPSGETFEFDDFPEKWNRGPLKWPDTAAR